MAAKAKAKAKAKPQRQQVPLPDGCEALLSRAQVCAALVMSMRKFQGMLATGEFPGFDMRLGSNPRWKVKTLNDWVASKCIRKDG